MTKEVIRVYRFDSCNGCPHARSDGQVTWCRAEGVEPYTPAAKVGVLDSCPLPDLNESNEKTTFHTAGIEVIRRKVNKSGSGAHTYVPSDWLGETVVIIRTGE